MVPKCALLLGVNVIIGVGKEVYTLDEWHILPPNTLRQFGDITEKVRPSLQHVATLLQLCSSEGQTGWSVDRYWNVHGCIFVRFSFKLK